MNMSSLWNTRGNEMTDATTRKNRDEETFLHERVCRFHSPSEAGDTKIPWNNSPAYKKANGKGEEADGEPQTGRIFSQAETHRNYSESEEAYGKQAFEAANVEGMSTRNRDEVKFPHDKISRFYAEAEVVNNKVPWNNSPADKQDNVENGEPLTRRIFSEAETHRNYSESEEAYGKQAYEKANVEGSTTGNRDEVKFPHEKISRFYADAEVANNKEPWNYSPTGKKSTDENGEPLTRRIFSQAETHRNYSESEEAYGKQAYEAANVEGGAHVKKIATRAAAGIGTNHENIHSGRRQYSEATADEEKDVTEEIEAPTEEEEEEIKRREEEARVKKEAKEERVKKTDEAARVEKKIVEDCEGVLSQRRHYPGTTTSNIFNSNA